MRAFVIFCMLILPFAAIAQKAKVDYDDKTHQVTVNGENVFSIERIDCGFGMVDCHFDVLDLEGNKVIRINYRQFNSPVEVSSSNPQGTVRYYEFIFLDSRQKAEVKMMGASEKNVAKSIVANNLFVGGKLDAKAVDDFVFSNGTPFSERVRF